MQKTKAPMGTFLPMGQMERHSHPGEGIEGQPVGLAQHRQQGFQLLTG